MLTAENKLVSIAMTTYNGEKYVEKQLRSIFTQTRQPDEIIICDDCSKDHTLEIVRRIVAEYKAEDRVRLVENQQNLGYIRNFHQAIGMTSGDYLFLADQDDEWYPHKLERVLEVMEETGAAAICTGFDLIDADSNLITDTDQFQIDRYVRNAGPGLMPITFHKLMFRNFTPGCTYCCTREAAEAFLKTESQALPHDYQIMILGTLLGKVYFLNEKTIGYRLHGNNTIGFQKKGTGSGIKLKRINKVPIHLRFLKDVRPVLPIPHRWFYYGLFYLRIPYIMSVAHAELLHLIHLVCPTK